MWPILGQQMDMLLVFSFRSPFRLLRSSFLLTPILLLYTTAWLDQRLWNSDLVADQIIFEFDRSCIKFLCRGCRIFIVLATIGIVVKVQFSRCDEWMKKQRTVEQHTACIFV